jgi:hypothetical protein
MPGEVAREPKHITVFQEISRLENEVESFEAFLEKLKRSPSPLNKSEVGKILPVPDLSFAVVYEGLPSELRQLRERLTKARLELEELLI